MNISMSFQPNKLFGFPPKHPNAGTCPFGLAHVDTPKGDLDGSISVGDHNDILITGSTVYPYGTTEGYPHMVDSAGIVQTETAHDYMECSNKGLCDHKTGMCECLPGYDGAACQRASCPSKAESPNRAKSSGSMSNLAGGGNFNGRSAFSGRAQAAIQVDQCSGHGTCHTISELAFLDNENIYELWDKDTSMGCKCDSGYVSEAENSTKNTLYLFVSYPQKTQESLLLPPPFFVSACQIRRAKLF